ncbi:proliferating cell nuclear antigen, partial [Enteropsectra breve]
MLEAKISFSENEGKGASEALSMLKKILDSLSDIVEQMELKANEQGISIQVMDSMHVALADIFIASNAFSSYRCDRDITIGVPLKQLVQILKGIVTEDSSVVTFIASAQSKFLTIRHETEESKYEFDIILINIVSENYHVPNLEYSSSIKMPTEKFRQISKVIGQFGEYLGMKAEKDDVTFKQSSDLLNNCMSMKSNATTVKIDSSMPVELEIAMKYINLINKVS